MPVVSLEDRRGRGVLAPRVDVGRPVGDDQPLVASPRCRCRRTRRPRPGRPRPPKNGSLSAAALRPTKRDRAAAPQHAAPGQPAAIPRHGRSSVRRRGPDGSSTSPTSCGSCACERVAQQGIPRRRNLLATKSLVDRRVERRSGMSRRYVAAHEEQAHQGAPGPRRRLEGDHQPAAAGRPPLVRRDRQGGRALRGRGPPARAAAHRRRRDAGRRGHRPDGARLRPPGHGRRPGHRRDRAGRRRASPRSTRSTTS